MTTMNERIFSVDFFLALNIMPLHLETVFIA